MMKYILGTVVLLLNFASAIGAVYFLAEPVSMRTTILFAISFCSWAFSAFNRIDAVIDAGWKALLTYEKNPYTQY